MPHPADQAKLDSGLRARIDSLSTTLLVDGVENAALVDLKDLQTAASEAGRDSLAAAAAEVISHWSQTTAAEREQALRNALPQFMNLLAGAANAQSAIPGPSQSININPLAQDPELVGDFVTEAREHLSAVENHMLTLEQKPGETEAIHAVFRGFHTIKGLAGFLEFMPIRDVAHEVETLLDMARNGHLTITPTIVDAVLASVDYLKHAIEAVEHSLQGDTTGPLKDNSELIHRIQKLIHSGGAGEGGDSEPGDNVAPGPELPQELNAVAVALDNLSNAVAATPAGPAGKQPVTTVAHEPASRDTPAKESSTKASKNTEAASVRVHTAKLDYLMDMVGEMVITQSLIRHNPALASVQNPKLIADLSQLARITSEVQRTTMGMRMITVGTVFQRSSRLVRDLSRKAGKQVQLEISGEDVELDKTIAEELTDPLLHMVRNSCDHGVEEPEMRIAAGKNPTARIRLSAYHQGGQIVVEISDDGRGLDREKIMAKAVQKGLVEPGAHLSEQEIFSLIFEPGFSTAAQITDISGRGVGMDVVRKNIQKLRGRIDIQSKVGQGTTFFLRLPLTLAIIEGLVVAVGNHRYIVPIYAVRELICPREDSISTVHGRNEMAMVRDRVLPVLRLSRRFNVTAKSEDPTNGLLVVAECQEQHFCLLVDEVLGKQEVVIKSLGETLKNIPGITGGAILGDGRVGLILDLEGVFRGNQ